MLAKQHFYVRHDGVLIPVTKLIEMAKNAGSYNVAEHYIVSLLYHARRNDLSFVFDEVENIRKHYHLEPLGGSATPASSNNMPHFGDSQKRQSEEARDLYSKMSQEQKESVLKEALVQLKLEEEKLFEKATFWIVVYLVVRDRLDEDLKAAAFCRYRITPDGWKKALTNSSLSNMGRYIKGEDKELTYYQMSNNPFKSLCEKYWESLQGNILMKKPRMK